MTDVVKKLAQLEKAAKELKTPKTIDFTIFYYYKNGKMIYFKKVGYNQPYYDENGNVTNYKSANDFSYGAMEKCVDKEAYDEYVKHYNEQYESIYSNAESIIRNEHNLTEKQYDYYVNNMDVSSSDFVAIMKELYEEI